tara:strand:+ start:122 stop:514 length:393 start_codon:yes stop_codon:yes gene_type:complete
MKFYYLLKNGEIHSSPFDSLKAGDPFKNSRINKSISEADYRYCLGFKNSQIKNYNKIQSKINRERKKLQDIEDSWILTNILKPGSYQMDKIRNREAQLDQAQLELEKIAKDQAITYQNFINSKFSENGTN